MLWVVEGGVPPGGRLDTVPLLRDLVGAMRHRCELEVLSIRQAAHPDRWTLHDVPVTDLGAAGGGLTGLRRRLVAGRWPRYDVVHAFGLRGPLTVALQIPAAVRVGSLWGGELRHLPHLAWGTSPWRQALIRLAMRRLDVVIAPSRRAAEALASSAVVVPIFPDPLPDVDPVVPGRRVVAIASLTPVKNPLGALEAFASATRRHPDVSLDWAGRGPLLDEMRARAAALGISGRVRLHGPSGRDRVASLLSGAVALLQASWHEACSVAAIEAAQRGVPVVSTAVGIAPEIAHGALTAPPGDMDQLAIALRGLLDDPSRARDLGEGAKRWAGGRDASWTAARYAELYERAAPQRVHSA